MLAVLRAQRVVETLVDGGALHLEDLVEAVLDVVHDGREVVLVELATTLLAELLEEVAEALKAVAHGVAHAALEQVAHGVLEVAEVHEVVGERLEDFVGIEGRDLLRAVPFAVAESNHDVSPSVIGAPVVLIPSILIRVPD